MKLTYEEKLQIVEDHKYACKQIGLFKIEAHCATTYACKQIGLFKIEAHCATTTVSF